MTKVHFTKSVLISSVAVTLEVVPTSPESKHVRACLCIIAPPYHHVSH